MASNLTTHEMENLMGVEHQQQDEEGELHEVMIPGEFSQPSEPAQLSESPRKPGSLKSMIKRGNFDEITHKLTPKALTKCDNNALLMAMEAIYELRCLANEKGPSEDDFTKLANSVDQFTSCLIDPLKSNTEARHTFGDSLDNVMDSAINWEQKRLLAHPVLYNLMIKKWLGKFGKLKMSSWFSFKRLLWLFLNIWCLFDMVMFPLLFAVSWFYVKHLDRRQKLQTRGMDVAFLINTTSKIADKAFPLMKRTIKTFIETYGEEQDKYHLIIHKDTEDGEGPLPQEIFANNLKDIQKGTAEFPALHKNLKAANESFFKTNEASSKKVIIFFTDHKTSKKRETDEVRRRLKELTGIELLQVCIGPYVDIRELEKITEEKQHVIHVGECKAPVTVAREIWHELQGKDIYESYLEYFTTPYFIFVRDTLSYLALLGLHVAICLTPSTVAFSGFEWVILVFFAGRTLNEFQQIFSIERLKRDEENETSKWKSVCRKYLSDRWNVLDLITLVIYLVTFILRIITWAFSSSVANNRALVVAGYLYGFNTMFLTLRAFGHVMETTKAVGAIQIALFHIMGDIATIFWQFIATILAFSIAITKVYVAERSYFSKESHTDDLACKTNGISCWWTMAKHLCWSLLGIAELEPLDSVDSSSVTVAHLLYGVFLVMGVILLINMMIALLSNTYQRVQDNSLMEWSFKKAITIQTYSTNHPIPVPLNLIWWIYLLCKKRTTFLSQSCNGLNCLRCLACCKRREREDDDEDNTKALVSPRETLNAVVKNLQVTYFTTYGYSFPITDDNKIDQILQETKRNQQMSNQIASRTFITNAFEEGTLPVGKEAWDAEGITVEGCVLTCQGEEICKTCQTHGSTAYHGARYRVPFSREFPHFKVLIQESDERFIGVGVVWQNYSNHMMPGRQAGTVGYLVDEGKIFGPYHPVDPTVGKEYDEGVACRGDVIGCTVKFENDRDANGKVEIIFTLNGKRITQDKIEMDYSFMYSSSRKMYPYICMGHPGMSLLAKMSSSKSDGPQLVTKNIAAISKTTENMASLFESSFQRVDSVFGLCESHLGDSRADVEDLMDDIIKGLTILEHFVEGNPQLGEEELQRMEGLEEVGQSIMIFCDVAESVESAPPTFWYEDLAYPSSEEISSNRLKLIKEEEFVVEHAQFVADQGGNRLEDLEPTCNLLKKTQDSLASFEDTTKNKFDSLFHHLEKLEKNTREGTETQKTKKDIIRRRLYQLIGFVRSKANVKG